MPCKTCKAICESSKMEIPKLNQDCLILIFANLPMNEKLKCRLICQEWKQAIDKLILGQQNLELYAVNGNLAAAFDSIKSFPSATSSDYSSYSSFFRFKKAKLNSTKKYLKIFFNSFLNFKTPTLIVTITTSISDFLTRSTSISSSMAGSLILDEINIDYNQIDLDDLIDIINQENQLQQQTFRQQQQYHQGFLMSSSTRLIQLITTNYWQFAFCSSSSLFSSYCFLKSKFNTHSYFHNFCNCNVKNRYKYSILLDRDQISINKLKTLLKNFQNILHLKFHNIDHLCDQLIESIVDLVSDLKSLSFINCSQMESISNYNWTTLNEKYQNLTSLTLRQCRLDDKQLTDIIKQCKKLVFLDVSDNLNLGKSLRYLGPCIECLICGNLSNDNEPMDLILSNISFGNGRNLKYLSIFAALGSLRTFNEFKFLKQLELHFYTDDEQTSFLSDIGLLSLETLILEQIRCFECPSALTTQQFEDMLRRSKNLKRLQITGDFDWNLRINDNSLLTLTKLCPNLKELDLNGNGQLTDYGLLYLSELPLNQLCLASFSSITDYSIVTLIKKISTLNQITLVDMPQITGRMINNLIKYCDINKQRNIEITFSDEKIERYIKKHYFYNNNNNRNNYYNYYFNYFQSRTSDQPKIQISSSASSTTSSSSSAEMAASSTESTTATSTGTSSPQLLTTNTSSSPSSSYPKNLKLKYDKNLCGKQIADSEPSDLQIMLIILMSTLILIMTVLTTVVVVLVPLSMLLIMIHEYLIDNIIELLINLLFQFLKFWQTSLLATTIGIATATNGDSSSSATSYTATTTTDAYVTNDGCTTESITATMSYLKSIFTF